MLPMTPRTPVTRLVVRALALATLLGALAGTAGCQQKPQLTSAWPVAVRERSVPRPPVTPRFSLTGLPAPSQAATRRRIISVKIENSPEARPQKGLNSADVVYETVTEGGITRFNALFQSRLPRVIGPIRSARLSDTWIVPQYNALFAYSGSSSTVDHALKGVRVANLSEDSGVASLYFRSSARRPPHNDYLYLTRVYSEARKRGFGLTTTWPGFRFLRRVVPAGTPARAVSVPLSQQYRVRWVYVPALHGYVRYLNGVRQVDSLTGKPILAHNVVVMWAKYRPASHDKVGSTTYSIDLGGSGRAMVLHDKQAYAGTWSAGPTTPPSFADAAGNAIRLSPGNTWFEVAPLDANVTLQ